jgi:hypothetical protein
MLSHVEFAVPIIRHRDPRIQLSNRHIQSDIRKHLHPRRELRIHLATDKVTLEADTMEGSILVEKTLGEREERFGLVVDAFDVVVVDVELDVRRGGVGVLELAGSAAG